MFGVQKKVDPQNVTFLTSFFQEKAAELLFGEVDIPYYQKKATDPRTREKNPANGFVVGGPRCQKRSKLMAYRTTSLYPLPQLMTEPTDAKFTANNSLNALAQKFGLDAGVKVAIAKGQVNEDGTPDSNWVAKSRTATGYTHWSWGRKIFSEKIDFFFNFFLK